METKLSCLVAGTCLLLLVGIVSGNHHQQNDQGHHLHMCNAIGESSEECAHYKNKDNARGPLMAEISSLKVKFFLHKNAQNPDEYIEIFNDNVTSVRAANPYPLSPKTEWKVLIPGFPMNGKSPFPNNVLHAYMQRTLNVPDEHYNILIVDWDNAACLYDTSFPNTTYTGAVGQKVADMLMFLSENGFANLKTDVHLIGFSVGAHVAGEASRFIFRKFNKKNLVYRLTALDPAGNKFWPNGFFTHITHPTPWERVPRIRRSFVGYLDAIHTSKLYGMGRNTGDIDFYPNGGDSQPGCTIYNTRLRNFEDLCSHVYASELFAKSINDKSMEGCTGCDYYDLYKKEKCECEDKPILGEFVDDAKIDGFPQAVGTAFIRTGDLGNFGKRFQKRLEDAGEPRGNRDKWYQLCS